MNRPIFCHSNQMRISFLFPWLFFIVPFWFFIKEILKNRGRRDVFLLKNGRTWQAQIKRPHIFSDLIFSIFIQFQLCRVWTVLCWQVTRILYQFLISDWINNSDKLTTTSAFIQIHVILSRIRSLKVNLSLFRIVLDFPIRFPCTESTLLLVCFYFVGYWHFLLECLVMSWWMCCGPFCSPLPRRLPCIAMRVWMYSRGRRSFPHLRIWYLSHCTTHTGWRHAWLSSHLTCSILLDAKYSACVITSILR